MLKCVADRKSRQAMYCRRVPPFPFESEGALFSEVKAALKADGPLDEASLDALFCASASLRRHIHAHPEPGFEEKNTQQLLRELLISFVGIPAEAIRSCAGTGLVADSAQAARRRPNQCCGLEIPSLLATAGIPVPCSHRNGRAEERHWPTRHRTPGGHGRAPHDRRQLGSALPLVQPGRRTPLWSRRAHGDADGDGGVAQPTRPPAAQGLRHPAPLPLSKRRRL